MNPISIESALVSAFASNFAGQTISAGTSYAELTPESLNVVVVAGEIEHSVGPLYKATVTIKIEAPALLGSDSLSSFTSAINSVRSSLESSYLTSNWPSGSPYFAGVWIKGTKTSQQEHLWMAEVEAVIGVTE